MIRIRLRLLSRGADAHDRATPHTTDSVRRTRYRPAVACRYLLTEVFGRRASVMRSGEKRALVDVDEDGLTTGRRVRQVRAARKKSLRVIAGLAGMSTTQL